jgi:adenine-specific DNA-methyltransferase
MARSNIPALRLKGTLIDGIEIPDKLLVRHMAKIEDLIAQIPDERLRKGIAAEVKALKKTKKFGLVFEEHLPETVRLPKMPMKPGDLVALKREAGNRLWRVKTINKNIATCDRAVIGYPATTEANKEFPVSDLVVVRSFGDAIYPALVPVDRVERGGPDKPWHVLINADNFHALQLLLYCYEGKVDVIYIDPPYNTGARDWKYNNDYVDKTDSFRHSKWLSMMKKRLMMAKRLLKPDGVLIVTIDVNELHRLNLLLDDIFRGLLRYMINIVINPKGVSEFNVARIEEQALFLCADVGRDLILGAPIDFMPSEAAIDAESEELPEQSELAELVAGNADDGEQFEYQLIRRRGTESRREDRPSMFYPIYVNESERKVVYAGEPIPLEAKPSMQLVDGLRPVWPINKAGMQGRWQVGQETMQELIDAQEIVLGAYNERAKSWTINRRVPKKTFKKLKTVWRHKSHDAGTHGTVLLNRILGKERTFSFPKSLYAVRDCLASILRERKGGLVLDFFAGSGTTYHATALLNAEDNGNRRCILVTNNEVNEEVSRGLNAEGIFPGADDFEKHGIAEAVCWPRCKYATMGARDGGQKLSGKYLNGRSWDAGFAENIEYFRLDFLNLSEIERGDAFQAILPILWMMAGCRGKREESKGSQAWFFPKQAPFAVLIKERDFIAFREALAEREDIEWIFLVTDSEENFGLMRRSLGRKSHCIQLYKNYLENFRINTPEVLREGVTV